MIKPSSKHPTKYTNIKNNLIDLGILLGVNPDIDKELVKWLDSLFTNPDCIDKQIEKLFIPAHTNNEHSMSKVGPISITSLDKEFLSPVNYNISLIYISDPTTKLRLSAITKFITLFASYISTHEELSQAITKKLVNCGFNSFILKIESIRIDPLEGIVAKHSSNQTGAASLLKQLV